MSATPKSTRRLPLRLSTLAVLVFLVVTIVPAFIAFALTPSDATVVKSVEAWNGCAYRVERGENLFRIGVRYGVSYQYLAQLNDIYNPNYIYAGQLISVPCGGSPVNPIYPDYHTVYPPYKCPWCQPFDIPANCGNTIQYTVQPGDNLFRIAVNNGSTIQWIRTQNNLWGKILQPGMVLNVPCQGYVNYPNINPSPYPTGGIITATPIPTPVPPNDNIKMKNGSFKPQSKTVTVGSTVTWVNNEAAGGPAYNVTSGQNGQADGLFSSGNVLPGGTFQFTFTTAGSYSYFSSTNPTTMTGEIIVTPQ